MSDPRLLTYKEAGYAYAVHWQTVKRWVREGKLPVVTLPSGRRRVYAPKCTPSEIAA